MKHTRVTINGNEAVVAVAHALSKVIAIYPIKQHILQEVLQANTSNSEFSILPGIADVLVKKSVWIIGDDGRAYDIGFGVLDHVLVSGRDVNFLVLDTEVYSNTGDQASKSMLCSAVA